MTARTFPALLLACLTLGGCLYIGGTSRAGPTFPLTVIEEIQPGVSTRYDVLDILGPPTEFERPELAAAVLDVFDPEPLEADSPLWDIPNVYISAHSSVSVDRYMDDVFDLVVANVQRYMAGEPLQNVIDRATL